MIFASLLLAACAAPRWTYAAPAGVSDSTMQADRRACHEESSVVRLDEDQVALEQQCMMTRGYLLKPQG